jgi:hypothetical protein
MSHDADLQQLADTLLASPQALDRLAALRGWTEPAIRRLGLGLLGDRVVFPVRDGRGALTGLVKYQPNPDRRGDLPKSIATPGSTRELFPAPETLDADAAIWLVEGEADAVAAHSLGLEATAVPGATAWDDAWAPRFARRDVVICADCDAPGRGLAVRAAEALGAVAQSVRIVDLARARDDGYDLSDLLAEAEGDAERGGVRAILLALADAAELYRRAADRPPRPRLSIADWRRALHDHLDGGEHSPAWPIPFADLLEATDGGIRPGEVWVVAGWTSNGKSVFADMIGDTAAAAGARVHFYLTEMTVVQRGLRAIARRGGLPLGALRKLQLTERQRAAAHAEVDRLPYAASVVTDWTPAQVAADIRATRTNVAIVDLLHGFDYQDERELSGIVDAFAKAATSDAGGLAGSAIVLVCQLNDTQMRDARSPRRPKPGLHSLKGSTWIKQRADVVLFVWLEDDADGNPGTDGEIWIAKNRNAGRAGVRTTLDPVTLVFAERTGGRPQ